MRLNRRRIQFQRSSKCRDGRHSKRASATPSSRRSRSSRRMTMAYQCNLCADQQNPHHAHTTDPLRHYQVSREHSPCWTRRPTCLRPWTAHRHPTSHIAGHCRPTAHTHRRAPLSTMRARLHRRTMSQRHWMAARAQGAPPALAVLGGHCHRNHCSPAEPVLCLTTQNLE